MLKANVESAGRSGANGSALVTLPFPGPTAATDFTGAIRNDHGAFGSRSRLIAAATSAEVRGDPSENLTPLRSVKIPWRRPVEIFQLVGSSGSTLLPLLDNLASLS